MNKSPVQFYRGVAVPRGIVVANPLEIRNPNTSYANSDSETGSRGVHFYTSSIEDHELEVERWAISRAYDSDDLEPMIIRFSLTEKLFPLLRGRLSGLFFQRQTSSYEWRVLSRFSQLGGEVLVDGKGMTVPDLSRLGIETGRLSEQGFVYERLGSSVSVPEGQGITMRERMIL